MWTLLKQRWGVWVTIGVLALCPSPVRAEILWLGVSVNGYNTSHVLPFSYREKQISMAVRDIQTLGIVLTVEEQRSDVNQSIFLSAIPDLTYEVDNETQTIDLRLPWYRLDPQVVQVLKTDNTLNYTPSAGWGGVFNYDISGEYIESRGSDSTLSGYGDARVFSPYGVFYTSFLGSLSEDRSDMTRLDTTITFDMEDDLFSVRLGDGIAQSTPWSRSVRLGGIFVGRNRSLRPDMISYPVPLLRDEVTVPSTLDVFVDDVLRLRQPLDPGPFAVDDLPVVTGQGEARIVVTDPLGRERIQNLPFYVSTDLLKEGWTDYALDVGAVRQRYGDKSNDYGALSLLGTLRHGISNTTTVEAHAEAAEDLGLLGGGAYVRVGSWGVVNASGAFSDSDFGAGYLAAAGFEHQSDIVTIGGQWIYRTEDFSDVARKEGDSIARHTFRFHLGVPLETWGSVGLTYVHIDEYERQDTSITAGTYTKNIFGAAYITASSLYDHKSDEGVFSLSLTIPLGDRINSSSSVQYRGRELTARQVLSRMPEENEGFGWALDAEAGKHDRRFKGTAYWDGPMMDSWAEVSTANGTAGFRGGVTGSLVAMAPGAFFISDRIDDAFAVVDTGDIAGVTVYKENRRLGITDSRGLLLVDGLASYGRNQVSIDPLDFPLQADIDHAQQVVMPRSRSGVWVDFKANMDPNVLVTLLQSNGSVVPLGATVRGASGTWVVGLDGQSYLTDISEPQKLIIAWPSGSCQADITDAILKSSHGTPQMLHCLSLEAP